MKGDGDSQIPGYGQMSNGKQMFFFPQHCAKKKKYLLFARPLPAHLKRCKTTLSTSTCGCPPPTFLFGFEKEESATDIALHHDDDDYYYFDCVALVLPHFVSVLKRGLQKVLKATPFQKKKTEQKTFQFIAHTPLLFFCTYLHT